MNDTTLTPQQIVRRKAAGQPLNQGEVEVEQRHLISVLLENSIGALNRVTNLFSARNFNLESVTVGPTNDSSISRITLVARGNNRKMSQVVSQLGRLVDTLEVEDLTKIDHVERELCLVKIKYTKDTRAEIKDICDVFRGRVVDIKPDSMTLEVTGPATKVNAFVGMMAPYDIQDIARSGRVAMRRELIYGN